MFCMTIAPYVTKIVKGTLSAQKKIAKGRLGRPKEEQLDKLKIFVRASNLIKKMITRSVMLFLNSVRRLLTARHLKSEKNGYTRSYKGYCLSSLLTSNI